MNKIIGGKLYDTSTAKKIGSRSYGCARDFDRFTETLYQKETGELFMHGSGGPLSHYGIHLSCNCHGSGETIVCESDFDPKKWVMDNLDADAYTQLFGAVEE